MAEDKDAANSEEALCAYDIKGYATIWKFQGSDTYLLDNLGVSVTYRNKGLGASVLKDIRNQIINDEIAEGKCLDDDSLAEFCLVVESDTPLEEGDAAENELRRRRASFIGKTVM